MTEGLATCCCRFPERSSSRSSPLVRRGQRRARHRKREKPTLTLGAGPVRLTRKRILNRAAALSVMLAPLSSGALVSTVPSDEGDGDAPCPCIPGLSGIEVVVGEVLLRRDHVLRAREQAHSEGIPPTTRQQTREVRAVARRAPPTHTREANGRAHTRNLPCHHHLVVVPGAGAQNERGHRRSTWSSSVPRYT